MNIDEELINNRPDIDCEIEYNVDNIDITHGINGIGVERIVTEYLLDNTDQYEDNFIDYIVHIVGFFYEWLRLHHVNNLRYAHQHYYN